MSSTVYNLHFTYLLTYALPDADKQHTLGFTFLHLLRFLNGEGRYSLFRRLSITSNDSCLTAVM